MAKSTKQMTLVPTTPPATEHVRVPLDELTKQKMTGPMPDRDFIQSVRDWGVLVPILVEQAPRGGWKLLAGKRRVKAVAKLREEEPPEGVSVEEWQERWSSLPAERVENDGWRSGGARLVENEQRSDNFSDLVDELEEMAAAGLSESTIREQTLVPAVRIRRAMKITMLNPVLRKAFREGLIVQRVAEGAARCSPEQQEQLAKIFRGEGQLTASDVREVRKVDQRAAQEALAGLGETDLAGAWRDEVARKLREALEFVPEVEGDLREDIRTLIDEVSQGNAEEAATRSDDADMGEPQPDGEGEPERPRVVAASDADADDEEVVG